MSSAAAVTRDSLLAIGATVRQARRSRRWTQRRLSAVSGVSQPMVSEVERALVPDLPLATAFRLLKALDVRVDLRLFVPTAAPPPVRDRAHARCGLRRPPPGPSGLARRNGGRGWRCALARFRRPPRLPPRREAAPDHRGQDRTGRYIGAVDRQLGSYERFAWPAAHALGWRPRAITDALLLLATDDNDRRLIEHRTYLDRRFRIRASKFGALVTDPRQPPERKDRCLAMIDPSNPPDPLADADVA